MSEKPLHKLPMEALEIRRLSWFGLAYLAERARDRAGPDTPERLTFEAEAAEAIVEAELIETEIARRRNKRKGKTSATEAIEPIAEPETELPPESPNVIAGPWAGSQLRR